MFCQVGHIEIDLLKTAFLTIYNENSHPLKLALHDAAWYCMALCGIAKSCPKYGQITINGLQHYTVVNLNWLGNRGSQQKCQFFKLFAKLIYKNAQ